MLVEKLAVLTGGESEVLASSRTSLVRMPRSVASELFGGWGVRI
jgi:hypothetical protein